MDLTREQLDHEQMIATGMTPGQFAAYFTGTISGEARYTAENNEHRTLDDYLADLSHLIVRAVEYREVDLRLFTTLASVEAPLTTPVVAGVDTTAPGVTYRVALSWLARTVIPWAITHTTISEDDGTAPLEDYLRVITGDPEWAGLRAHLAGIVATATRADLNRVDPALLDDTDQALWAALTADGEVAEQMPDFTGYEGFDTYREAQQVATALVDSNNLGLGGFSMSFEADHEGQIGGYCINLFYPALGVYLSVWDDVKGLTGQRDAIGESAALAYARAFHADCQRVLTNAAAADFSRVAA